ncbi:MAG: RNA polymerase sigma factor [Thermoguttaceae bacterium]|jgi:RNA polymerase sigma-70 factor (ECF subfamily)
MMSYDRTTDEELMLRVAAGNREAMSPLLRRYASPLLTFIRRMTGDWHRAEELFQEAFLAVWLNRNRYEHSRPFRSWLFGIAANKCRADFRKAPGLPEPLSDWLDPPATHEPSPVEAAISSEAATLVTQAVAALPPKQRAVLVLRLWNGMEYAEIAQALERTESTIRSQMFHALAGMRRHLEPRMRRTGEDCHDRP